MQHLSPFHPIRAVRENPKLRLLLLFGLEGLLLQYTASLYGLANNLYATNLGATDTQIGLIQTVPSLVALLCMIPVGLLANRARTSRTVPFALAVFLSFAYFAYASVPMFGQYRMAAYFIFLGMTVGGVALYNAQWQTFFGDAVQSDFRSNVFAARNRCLFSVGIIVPLLCGNLLTACPDTEEKLLVMRIFFYIAGVCMLVQAFVLRRIPCPERREEDKVKIGLSAFKDAFRHMIFHKPYRSFFICIMLFYFGWQMDWSITYIAQIQYIGMNEAQLSLFLALTSVSQMIFVGLFSRLCKKHSEHFTLILVAGGLILCSLSTAIAPVLPEGMRVPFYMIGALIGCTPLSAASMCLVPMLLQVTPEKNRALIISIHTLFVTLSNSLLPLLGVQLYRMFGSDAHGMLLMNLTLAAYRIAVTILLICRFRRLKRAGNLFRPLA